MRFDRDELERQRLRLQERLDGVKSGADRNRRGQFSTPPALARDVVGVAVDLFPRSGPIRFLDPAFGTGAFYSALLDVVGARSVDRAEGFEIDDHYGVPTRSLWRETGLRLHLADFTTQAPAVNDDERFNLLVCNPPYVRHHHLPTAEKARLREASRRASGVTLGGLAGLYCHFLALSHEWLSKDGISVWLVPSEFMDVNYGRALKEYLLSRVELLRVHRFDPQDVQFDDALVSSAVLLFAKREPPPGHQVQFTFGGTLTQPRVARLISAATLATEAKWTRFPRAEARGPRADPTLGDFFSIKRGIATGDNSFFVLRPEDVERAKLPASCLTPILPSPRHLDVDEIEADESGNPRIANPAFLVECRLDEEDVKRRLPHLWDYFEAGRARGVHERYLCRHRNPWYSQETRPPAPFLCTYMGRGNGRTGSAFRFIRNHSRATAANAYLLLYPRTPFDRLLRDASMVRRVWAALAAIRPGELLDEGRVYGGGLHKMEPREMANVAAGPVAEVLGRSHVCRPPKQLAIFG